MPDVDVSADDDQYEDASGFSWDGELETDTTRDILVQLATTLR